MTLKPNSLKPMDIADLVPALSGDRGTEALVKIHAAIEEIQATADQLIGPLSQQQRDLTAGDELGVIELVSDLRELFEHLGGHCAEASDALWGITESLAGMGSGDLALVDEDSPSVNS